MGFYRYTSFCNHLKQPEVPTAELHNHLPVTPGFPPAQSGRVLAARLLHDLTKASGDSELCLFKPPFFHATQLQSCAWQNIISILCFFLPKEANQEPDRLMGTEPHFLASLSTCEAKRKAAHFPGLRAPLASWEVEHLLASWLRGRQRADCFPGCERHGPAGDRAAAPGLLSACQAEPAGLRSRSPQPLRRQSAVLLSRSAQQSKKLHTKMKFW